MSKGTQQRQVRVSPEVEQEARQKSGLEDVDFATLVRVGLLVLAGYAVAEALSKATAGAKPGPKPR